MGARANDGLFEWLDKAGSFILANLLWVLLSLPLVTLPMATAGLFATMLPAARGQSPEVFRDFFRGMRQYAGKATLVILLDVAVGGLVVINVLIFRLMDASGTLTMLSQSATLFVGLTVCAVNLYVWPLMVAFDDWSLRQLLNTALKFVFAYPLWSGMMLFLAFVPFIVSLLFLPAAVLLLATFSTSALLVSRAAWHIIQRHLPEES